MIDDERCLRTDAEMAALERIAADDHARRELLWLRAMEQEDHDSAIDLEKIDPELLDRLGDVIHAFATAGPLDSRERRLWFARQWQACYDRHAGDRFVACACGQCMPSCEASPLDRCDTQY
jgi:hypothetical protein